LHSFRVSYNWQNIELGNDNTGILHVFKMRIGMKEFDHCILALLKSSSEKGMNNQARAGMRTLASAMPVHCSTS